MQSQETYKTVLLIQGRENLCDPYNKGQSARVWRDRFEPERKGSVF